MTAAARRVLAGRFWSLVGLVALVVVQLLLAQAYTVRGVAWHWLLHTLAGLGLGLTLGAVVALLRRRPVSGLLAALAGQAVSVAPDLLFVLGRVPHARWMDVFLGHITLHLTVSPLGVSLAVFLLGGWAWWLSAEPGRRRTASVLVLVAAVVYVGALATARPVPQQLADYGPGAGALELLSDDPADWRCTSTSR